MERVAAPSHLHDPTTSSSAIPVPRAHHNNNPGTATWNSSSSTLPHGFRSSAHHHHQQQHFVQLHPSSGSNAPHHQFHQRASPQPPSYQQYQQQQLLSSTGNALSHVRSRSNSSGIDAGLLNTSADSIPAWRSGNENSAALSTSLSGGAPPPLSYSSASSSVSQQNLSSLLPPPQHPLHQGFSNGSSGHPPQSLNSSFSSGVLNTSFGGTPLSLPPQKQLAVMEQQKEEWFHGFISRDEAEQLLHPREDGLFLVRESTNFPGDYTLCVCYLDKVEHYRVYHKENSDKPYTIDDEGFFDSLNDLIEHYKADADGLCTQLVRPQPSLKNAPNNSTTFNQKEQQFKDSGWVINKNELKIGDSIGKGEFGDVMLGEFRNKKVAVKRLKDSSKAALLLLDEASLMTSLRHDNLVQLIGLVFEDSNILLLTEFMSKGSLVDYLRSRGRLHVTKGDQIMFACDTAAGMEYLEAHKVIHRDLAARNVLISQDSVAKVCDFGLAASTEGRKVDGGKVPIKWTAPEALREGKYSSKSDMWSFGILLWEIYSFGRVPYPKIPLADVMKHVEKGYRMEIPDNCPSDVFELMSQAWQYNPYNRPTFKQVHNRLLQIKQNTQP